MSKLKIVDEESSRNRPLVSVVMPCLNEEESIGACVTKIQAVFKKNGIDGEIVVCDNGSTDRSVEIATGLGARVVHETKRGYGNAYITAFNNARGRYFVMGDSDDTYDFGLIPKFLDMLQNQGYEFVSGSRYLGDASQIPFSHRYFGNPALTGILNILFGCKYTDVYCGLRAFSRESYARIHPVTPGMEFNLELAINGALAGLKIGEIPIVLGPRKGESKLRTLRDGWRSLRMMLLYCPNKVFVWPGFAFLLAGAVLHVGNVSHRLIFDGRPSSTVTGIVAAALCIVGFKILSLGLHAKTYSWSYRFDKDNATLSRFYRFFTLEKGIVLGALSLAAGAAIFGAEVYAWLRSGMQPLRHPEWVTLALTLFVAGTETVFSSLFISAMSMQKVSPEEAAGNASDGSRKWAA